MQSSCPVGDGMNEAGESYKSDDPTKRERGEGFIGAVTLENFSSPSADSNSRAGLIVTPESRPRGEASLMRRCAAACRRDLKQCPESRVLQVLSAHEPVEAPRCWSRACTPQWKGIANGVLGPSSQSWWIKVWDLCDEQVLGASLLARRWITTMAWSLAAVVPRPRQRVNSLGVDKPSRSRKMSLPI